MPTRSLLGCAAAPAFGWTAADMLAALEENRANAVALVIEADPVAAAVQALAAAREPWTGTAAELLAEVDRRTPAERQRERDWPKDATQLGWTAPNGINVPRRGRQDPHQGSRQR